MQIFFTKFIVPLMLIIVSFFDPFMPECACCDSTGFVTCENCNGEGTVYVPAYDLRVSCDDCSSSGKKLCPECPDYAQFYYSFKANMDQYK